ncbi:hypothetical protein QZH41_011291, partial [Actinostola sp. cb2023]
PCNNPANVECIPLSRCEKDIRGHPRALDIWDATLMTETQLILTRVGLFESHDKQLDLTVCPRHREMFGTRWRTCRKTCSIPTEWTTHKSSNAKGDRGITAVQSKGLHQLTGHLVPVGSRICKRCRAQLKVAIDSVGEPLSAPALTTTESSLPTAEATLPPQIVLSPPTDTVSIQSSDDNEVRTLSRYTKSVISKVHVIETSDITDHCITHALSDTKETQYAAACDHDHETLCSSCEEIKIVLNTIEAAVYNSGNLPADYGDDIKFTCQQAIQAWKAHQLRSIQQEIPRISMINGLAPHQILITQADWAMKFLPQKISRNPVRLVREARNFMAHLCSC